MCSGEAYPGSYSLILAFGGLGRSAGLPIKVPISNILISVLVQSCLGSLDALKNFMRFFFNPTRR